MKLLHQLLLFLLSLLVLVTAINAFAVEKQTADLKSSNKMVTICYKGVGCFSTYKNDKNTYDRPVYQLPQSPKQIAITFQLFTPSCNDVIEVGRLDKLKQAGWDTKKSTKFIIHGYFNDKNSDWVLKMRDALITRCRCNVFVVSWGSGANGQYETAASNTRVVGAVLSNFIRWLETQGTSRSDFHVIGFSLGAQIAGYAGRRLNEDGYQLGRISGLDAASPYFEGTNVMVRLDPSDAKFVDVIHTDGSDSITAQSITNRGGYGTFAPLGHFDFYPNGGKNQPGCSWNNALWIYYACSHRRAVELYTATIKNPSAFPAVPCSSYKDFNAGKCRCPTAGCPLMGYAANQWQNKLKQPVKLYSITAGSQPYGVPNLHIKVQLGNFSTVEGFLYILLQADCSNSFEKLLIAGPTKFESGKTLSATVPFCTNRTEYLRAKLTWLKSSYYRFFNILYLNFFASKISIKSVTISKFDQPTAQKFCTEELMTSKVEFDLKSC